MRSHFFSRIVKTDIESHHHRRRKKRSLAFKLIVPNLNSIKITLPNLSATHY